MSANRLLIVDDEVEIGRLIEHVAVAAGFEVVITTDVDVFREKARAWQPSHIVLDLHMPGADGVEVLRFLAEWECAAQIIIASGFDTKIIESARQIGIERGLNIAGTLSKPIRVDALSALLKEIKGDEFTVDVAAIEHAIEHDELSLVFQPKVRIAADMSAGPAWTEVAGFEALLRWEHPTHGPVPPGDFIPVAEATGLMERLTSKVLELALATAREWNAQGHAVSVSVNVSAEDLYDVGVADTFSLRCSDAGVAPDTVVIELTETAAMRDVTMAMDILTRLRIKGFKLSMDDFGTGYSSLVQLQRMPFSELKIDRTFFRDGLRSVQDVAIVKTMIDLGHNLGLVVVAEGVETEHVLRKLSELGCDVAQGYHIARPMPAAEVGPWLRKL